MNERITLGSLFDGIGGFPLSGTMCGVEPVWASEIEPFPIAVTMNRFPNMKHLGSVTDIKGDQIEPVDIITFGSPCQDLSVAGKQAGIHDGERSNLFFEAVRIIKEMREHDRSTGRTGFDVRPRFAVWENVPGAFSSGKGKDFQAVLQTLCEVADPNVTVPLPEKGKWNKSGHIVGDGYSIAWRVYDAQYWGVPQRRKRIYLIADFASERAGEILFECEGVCGDSEESREARQGTAEDAEGGIGRGVCFGIGSYHSNAMKSNNPQSGFYLADTSRTLDLNGGNPTCNQGRIAIIQTYQDTAGALCMDDFKGINRQYVNQDKVVVIYDARGNGEGASTLTGDHENRITDYTAVAVCAGNGQLNNATMRPISNALDCMHDQQIILTNSKPPHKYIVRRLTPLECCRLQGYPDGWTENISFDALSQEQVDQLEQIRKTWAEANGKNYKPCKNMDALRKWFEGLRTDSAEYKAYGNSLAIPCSHDVIRRVAKEIRQTNE